MPVNIRLNKILLNPVANKTMVHIGRGNKTVANIWRNKTFSNYSVNFSLTLPLWLFA